MTLHFAELYFAAAGKREFNVSINGTQVLTNFDIVATAGGIDFALQGSFSTTASTTGQIVIQFSNGAVNQPSVNGIEVQPATVPTLVAINAGDAATGSWLADQDVSGGSASGTKSAIATSLVTNPPPQAVLQTAREGVFTYTIPGFTPGSTHTVNLYFAELYFTAAGKRQFNIILDGTQVLTNFDIVATADAANTAVERSFSTAANSSGQIVIQFSDGVVNQSAVNGPTIQ